MSRSRTLCGSWSRSRWPSPRRAAFPIEAEDVLGTIRVIAEATRDNKSSMLQDLQRGRHTEIDAINGALIARAREHGMPCPANQLLASMVRAAESPAELDLRRSAEKFTSTFRPQGAASAYELLFVPVDGDSGFAPSVTEVRRCTQGWASLLEQIEGPEDLAEANWIEAGGADARLPGVRRSRRDQSRARRGIPANRHPDAILRGGAENRRRRDRGQRRRHRRTTIGSGR